MPIISVNSPMNGGGLNTYYLDFEYPYDYNGALDFVRPKTGIDIFPYPQAIGAISGLLPLMDVVEYGLMRGKKPSGPPVDYLNYEEIGQIAFADISGGMVKVSG